MCIFCKIINKDIPSKIVFEDEKLLAIEDISPQAPVHILIMPKKHIETLNEFFEEDFDLVSNIYKAAVNIAKEKGISESGYRISMNCNMEGGQTVYHVHFHLLGGRHLTGQMG